MLKSTKTFSKKKTANICKEILKLLLISVKKSKNTQNHQIKILFKQSIQNTFNLLQCIRRLHFPKL